MEGSSLPAASAWASTVRSWKRTSTDGSWIPTLQCITQLHATHRWSIRLPSNAFGMQNIGVQQQRVTERTTSDGQ